ncbi:MAG: UDP-glucose 4-epimerase GalE [Moorea sp. SIO3G5]|nr:UDP-glucose 4-epimerase GalE [Moorena sp. SIO3G5]
MQQRPAAVYGELNQSLTFESAPTVPINPYGRSKLINEWMIRDYAAASGLRYLILRYFNVAGADPFGRIGERNAQGSHLIKVACDAAKGRRECLQIFGTDFPTPDGTAVRDYIHVWDLATAHLDGLQYLEQGGQSQVLNCGYGHGYSVREVVKKMKDISGVDFPVVEVNRRKGDPASVVASVQRIREVLGWMPNYDDLGVIVETTWEWYKRW